MRFALLATTLALLAAPVLPTSAQNPSECVPTHGLVSWWRGEGDASDALGHNPGTAARFDVPTGLAAKLRPRRLGSRLPAAL